MYTDPSAHWDFPDWQVSKETQNIPARVKIQRNKRPSLDYAVLSFVPTANVHNALVIETAEGETKMRDINAGQVAYDIPENCTVRKAYIAYESN